MTRTPSVTWSRQASPVAFRAFFSKLGELLFGFSGLASRGVRGFQVSPALDDPPVGDPPNHNSGNSSRCFDRVSVPFHRLRTTTLWSSAIMSSMVTLKSGTFLRAARPHTGSRPPALEAVPVARPLLGLQIQARSSLLRCPGFCGSRILQK
jgi:hypothetical protein